MKDNDCPIKINHNIFLKINPDNNKSNEVKNTKALKTNKQILRSLKAQIRKYNNTSRVTLSHLEWDFIDSDAILLNYHHNFFHKIRTNDTLKIFQNSLQFFSELRRKNAENTQNSILLYLYIISLTKKIVEILCYEKKDIAFDEVFNMLIENCKAKSVLQELRQDKINEGLI